MSGNHNSGRKILRSGPRVVKNISLDPALAKYLEGMDNFSGYLNALLEERRKGLAAALRFLDERMSPDDILRHAQEGVAIHPDTDISQALAIVVAEWKAGNTILRNLLEG
jgi:hypothetical protein